LPSLALAEPQLGIIPYAGVDIAVFEMLKERLLEEYDGLPPAPLILGAGMVSSSIAQFASYPLAVVRTRLQVCHRCREGCLCSARGLRGAGLHKLGSSVLMHGTCVEKLRLGQPG
jgi:hypothetical protein